METGSGAGGDAGEGGEQGGPEAPGGGHARGGPAGSARPDRPARRVPRPRAGSAHCRQPWTVTPRGPEQRTAGRALATAIPAAPHRPRVKDGHPGQSPPGPVTGTCAHVLRPLTGRPRCWGQGCSIGANLSDVYPAPSAGTRDPRTPERARWCPPPTQPGAAVSRKFPLRRARPEGAMPRPGLFLPADSARRRDPARGADEGAPAVCSACELPGDAGSPQLSPVTSPCGEGQH